MRPNRGTPPLAVPFVLRMSIALGFAFLSGRMSMRRLIIGSLGLIVLMALAVAWPAGAFAAQAPQANAAVTAETLAGMYQGTASSPNGDLQLEGDAEIREGRVQRHHRTHRGACDRDHRRHADGRSSRSQFRHGRRAGHHHLHRQGSRARRRFVDDGGGVGVGDVDESGGRRGSGRSGQASDRGACSASGRQRPEACGNRVDRSNLGSVGRRHGQQRHERTFLDAAEVGR